MLGFRAVDLQSRLVGKSRKKYGRHQMGDDEFYGLTKLGLQLFRRFAGCGS